MKRECVILTDSKKRVLGNHTEKYPDQQEAGGIKEKMGTRGFIVVSMGRNRWGRVDRLLLVILNNFSGFWGTSSP